MVCPLDETKDPSLHATFYAHENDTLITSAAVRAAMVRHGEKERTLDPCLLRLLYLPSSAEATVEDPTEPIVGDDQNSYPKGDDVQRGVPALGREIPRPRNVRDHDHGITCHLTIQNC